MVRTAASSMSLLLLLLMACTVWVGTGCAKDPDPPEPEITRGAQPGAEPDVFARIDRDGDGRLSRREYAAMWRDQTAGERNFRRADRNGDGFLSREEFPKARRP